jgi:hypothetical protein
MCITFFRPAGDSTECTVLASATVQRAQPRAVQPSQGTWHTIRSSQPDYGTRHIAVAHSPQQAGHSRWPSPPHASGRRRQMAVNSSQWCGVAFTTQRPRPVGKANCKLQACHALLLHSLHSISGTHTCTSTAHSARMGRTAGKPTTLTLQLLPAKQKARTKPFPTTAAPALAHPLPVLLQQAPAKHKLALLCMQCSRHNRLLNQLAPTAARGHAHNYHIAHGWHSHPILATAQLALTPNLEALQGLCKQQPQPFKCRL